MTTTTTTAGGETPARPRWADALILMVCQSSQSLVLGGVALFLPLIRRDLHLSFAQAGTLDAASSLVYAFMQIPSGLLADPTEALGAIDLGVVGRVGDVEHTTARAVLADLAGIASA